MLSIVIPALAALATAVVGGWVGAGFKERADRAVRLHEHRRAVIAATGDLVRAIAAHRSSTWDRESLFERGGATGQDLRDAVAAIRATRAAVSKPHVELTLLCPQIRDAADDAVTATYAMASEHGTATEPLPRRRERAKAAETALWDKALALVWSPDFALPVADRKPRRLR